MNAPHDRLDIRVASPCPARWENMTGDDRVRFCQDCSKHVYNLSAMTATETAALIAEKNGQLCGRFYRRTDGTVLHREDCPVGLVARHWKTTRSHAGALASLVLSLLGLGSVRANDAEKKETQTVPPLAEIAGEICVAPTPTPTPAPTPTPTPPPKPDK